MQNRILVFIVCFAVTLLPIAAKPISQPTPGPGFAFSGAGGRIAQHVALMEALVKGLHPSGEKIRPHFLSGASSGSISSVALNAILESEETGSNRFTWDDYKDLVFNLTAGQVYDDSWEGLAKIFVYNLEEGYILDNTPLEKLLGQYFAKMGYYKMSDLYLPTAISLVNQSSGLDLRVWSTDPAYADLDLLQVVIASASLPIAFRPRQVDGLGDTYWIDGGTGIDTIPVYPLIYHPDVTELYILCYGGAEESGGSSVPPELDYIKILKNSLATFDDMRVDLYAGAIDIATDSTIPSYLFIPNLNETFSALDFSHEKHQYDLAMQWAMHNDPVKIN